MPYAASLFGVSMHVGIVDTIQEASGNITDGALFDQIRSFVKYASSRANGPLPTPIALQLELSDLSSLHFR